MKYSSHHYLRTDATLGRYPIIEVDDNGYVVDIQENVNGIAEIERVKFYSGVIVPRFSFDGKFCFNSKADFCNQIIKSAKSKIVVGEMADFVLVTCFDQTTFVSNGNAKVEKLLP